MPFAAEVAVTAADSFISPEGSTLSIPNLTPGEFNYFRGLLEQQAGIHIVRGKMEMLQGRLRKRLRALDLSSYTQYQSYLQEHAKGEEFQLFVNTLTTNKTEFFREEFHYDYLQKSLQQRQESFPVYIWSAACSSGEEAYSLAILCEELKLELNSFNYRILATDIDTNMLRISETGVYEKDQLAKMPARYQQKYFELCSGPDDPHVRVNARLKRWVKFRQHNLIDYTTAPPIKFNIIFVRNVLFYFPKKTTKKIVQQLAGQLLPGGLIFVSLTESLSSMNTGLIQVGASIYRCPTPT